jgi:hypothetical protein
MIIGGGSALGQIKSPLIFNQFSPTKAVPSALLRPKPIMVAACILYCPGREAKREGTRLTSVKLEAETSHRNVRTYCLHVPISLCRPDYDSSALIYLDQSLYAIQPVNLRVDHQRTSLGVVRDTVWAIIQKGRTRGRYASLSLVVSLRDMDLRMDSDMSWRRGNGRRALGDTNVDDII